MAALRAKEETGEVLLELEIILEQLENVELVEQVTLYTLATSSKSELMTLLSIPGVMEEVLTIDYNELLADHPDFGLYILLNISNAMLSNIRTDLLLQFFKLSSRPVNCEIAKEFLKHLSSFDLIKICNIIYKN